MRKVISLLTCVLLCLLLVSVAQAQGVGASGSIRGTVADPNGAVLPNVTVTVTDTVPTGLTLAVVDGNMSLVYAGLERTGPNDPEAAAGRSGMRRLHRCRP